MGKDIEEQLKKIKDMEVSSATAKEMIKVPLMNTRLSSRLSILLAITPALFILGVMFSEYLNLDYPLISGFYHWVVDLDQKYGDSSVLNWILRFLILGGPALIVFINLLSITHVYYNRPGKEIIFTFKLRWLSITIVLFGLALFLYFFGYLIVENL